MRFAVTLMILAFAAFGCTRMYDTPEVSKGLQFAGIRDIVAPGNDARLVLSHGMCSGMAG